MALIWRCLLVLAAAVLAAGAETDPCLQQAYAEENCALPSARPNLRHSHLDSATSVPQMRIAAHGAITRRTGTSATPSRPARGAPVRRA